MEEALTGSGGEWRRPSQVLVFLVFRCCSEWGRLLRKSYYIYCDYNLNGRSLGAEGPQHTACVGCALGTSYFLSVAQPVST